MTGAFTMRLLIWTEFRLRFQNTLSKSVRSHIYDKVFILPPWQEIFTNDQERIENFNETEAIHRRTHQDSYTAYGMPANCCTQAFGGKTRIFSQ